MHLVNLFSYCRPTVISYQIVVYNNIFIKKIEYISAIDNLRKAWIILREIPNWWNNIMAINYNTKNEKKTKTMIIVNLGPEAYHVLQNITF